MPFTEGQGRDIPFRQPILGGSLAASLPPTVDSMEHSLPYLIGIGPQGPFLCHSSR